MPHRTRMLAALAILALGLAVGFSLVMIRWPHLQEHAALFGLRLAMLWGGAAGLIVALAGRGM